MNFSALERTERQWTELAGSVGLTINNIWRVEKSRGGIGQAGLIEMCKKGRVS
jgi:hypothetical protein